VPVVTGDTPNGTFSRSAARNAAARAAGDWTEAAVIDADCVISVANLALAFDTARALGRVVIAHDRFYKLTPEGTERALAEPDTGKWRLNWLYQPNWTRLAPGGVIVFPRAAWDAVRGYDERLSGWGFEDAAMLLALTDLADGYQRVPGVMWHLDHPTGRGAVDSAAKGLYARYKSARGDAPAMRALIEERM
jgi:hypothetical protein